MPSPDELDASAAIERIRSQSLTSEALVAACLGRIDTREGVVTALNDDGYQVATERGEVAVNRHDLLRVRS